MLTLGFEYKSNAIFDKKLFGISSKKDKISTIKGNEFKNISCNVCGGKC